MKQIKRVPAEEFAEHAAEYLKGDEPVTIERDGEVIGRYVPEPNGHSVNGTNLEQGRWQGKAELRAKFAELRGVLEEIYARTGMTEDEFADLFDTNKPFPYDLDGKL